MFYLKFLITKFYMLSTPSNLKMFYFILEEMAVAIDVLFLS